MTAIKYAGAAGGTQGRAKRSLFKHCRELFKHCRERAAKAGAAAQNCFQNSAAGVMKEGPVGSQQATTEFETMDFTMPQDAAGITKPRKRTLPAVGKRLESQVEREIFARNLRRFRTEADLSQRELAHRTGVAQAHISEMENAMQNVCIDTMVKLAQAVRKPLCELLLP